MKSAHRLPAQLVLFRVNFILILVRSVFVGVHLVLGNRPMNRKTCAYILIWYHLQSEEEQLMSVGSAAAMLHGCDAFTSIFLLGRD